MSIIKKYKDVPIQVKASFWFLICSFLQKGISTITTPIFTRLLSTSEYGQYSTFNSWLGIIGIFVSLNLSAGVYTQGLVKFDQEREVYSSSLQGLTLTLVTSWTIVYILLHEFWNRIFSLSTIQVIAMLSMIWSSAVFNFWAARQRVLYRYRSLVFVTLIVSVVKPVLGIVLVSCASDKVTARILGLAFVELIAYTGFFILQMYQGRVFYSKKFWQHALLFNIPLIPHYLSQTVLNNADRIMIKNMVNDEAAGIYSLAYSISQIMTLFNNALSQTLGPWVYQKIKDKKIEDISEVAYGSLFIVGVVNLLLIAVAPEIVSFFAPSSYYDAIWVIPPVAMSSLFMFSYDLFAKFGFYYEKTKLIMYASVIGAVLNIVLNYIFIGFFGYYAAGYTTLVCYIAYAIGHYCFMNKICQQYLDGIKVYDTRKLIGLAAGFMIIGFVFTIAYKVLVIRIAFILVNCIFFILGRKRILVMMEKVICVMKK